MLQVGELWYRQGQEKHYLSIAFGFAEVLPDRVTILAQIAERAEEIDVARAEAAKKRAEERLREADRRHRLRAGAHRADEVARSACRSRAARECGMRLQAARLNCSSNLAQPAFAIAG